MARPSFSHSAYSTITILALQLSLQAGGVRIVDAGGQRNFADIQSAVNAAVDGDVLLVGAGSYAGFTVDGKNLTILAGPGSVSVSSTVTLRHVSGSCTLVGFSVGPPAAPQCGLGLSVHDCTGVLAVEQCHVRGSVGSPLGNPCGGDSGAEIRNCAAVVLSACSFEGGKGASFLSASNEIGGHGCLLDSATVAAYDCAFRGGEGGAGLSVAGDGGDGLHSLSSWLFTSGSSFVGGDGGDGTSPSVICGAPGAGLFVDAGAIAHLLDPTAAGGGGGTNCIPSGTSSAYRGGGSFDFLPGVARSLDLSWLSVDREPWSAVLTGVPGDQLFLNRSLAPVFQYEAALSGVCTSIVPPFPAVAPLATLPASGSLALGLRQRLLPAGVVARVQLLQPYSIDPAGPTVLGTPRHVLSLNWDSPPDGNGNGINDYAEVIAGVSSDWNHDLIPDSGGVRIVDSTGLRNYSEIQSAVDAALDGDVLLVGEGIYPGFTLDGKGLSILAAPPGASVSITGRVTVENVSGNCLLGGLSVAPTGHDKALYITSCSGHVRVQGCTFTGSAGACSFGSCGPGSPAAEIVQSAQVVLAGCVLRAGDAPNGGLYGSNQPGACGLRLQSSTAALYDCSLAGGSGPDSHHDDQGPGGAAVLVAGSWLFASGGSCLGGRGGDDLSGSPLGGACGGAGVAMDSGSSVQVLEVAAQAGPSGSPSGACSGVPSIDNQGGQLALLAGSARSCALASLCVDRAPWSFSIAGQAGDQVFLNRSLAPVFHFEAVLSGVCTAKLPPFANLSPLGVVPFSGDLALPVPQRLLPASLVAQLGFLQGYVIDGAGSTFLSTPLQVVSLNWDSPPDCNGNGINDYAEVIAGVTPDLDHNLLPDGCP